MMKNHLFFIFCAALLTSCGGSSSDSSTSNNQPIDITVFVGKSDTIVEFQQSTHDGELYRSTDQDCDIANYALCTNGQFDIIDGTPIIDTAYTLSQPAYYVLSNDKSTSLPLYLDHNNVISQQMPFEERSSAKLAIFNDRLWLMGGNPRQDDVWSSSDGVSWRFESDSYYDYLGDLSYRPGPAIFNEKMWAPAASTGGSLSSQVYSSDDGQNWEYIGQADFDERKLHGFVTFKNKLWVIAGCCKYFPFSYLTDVWSSSNGIDWQLETASVDFSDREIEQIFVFDDKIWIIGGYNGGDGYIYDAWSSEDGINWVAESVPYNFIRRLFRQHAVHNNKLWVVGGYEDYTTDSSLSNKAWSSTDGINWTLETGDGPFSPRNGASIVSFDGKLWMFGGNDGSKTLGDVWVLGQDKEWRKAHKASFLF